MSFIRPEDRSTRLRRTGEAGVSLTENEIAQINAINNTSSYCRTLFFSYLTLGTTLFILVSGTTHEDLLRETPVKMPLFDIGVPLLTFYVVAPFLFALFFFNLLNKLSQLRMQIEDLGNIDRALIRERLFPFDYTLLIGSFAKNSSEKTVLWLIVGPALYLIPVALFVYTQYKFLAYHSTPITTWHSLLVLLSVGSLALFHAGSESPTQLTVAALRRYAIALTIWVISQFFLTPPDSWIDKSITKNLWEGVKAVGMYRNLELPGRTFWAADPPPEIIAVYIEKYGADNTKIEEARLRYGRPMDLRGRDLRYANLERSSLVASRLDGALLQGVNLKRAELQAAILRDAQLQGADLVLAELQGANLMRAELQGADLRSAQLRGANLVIAQLQGANLRSAELQGADLRIARLQGASLVLAQLRGANLWRAELQVADLWSAELQGAGLKGAQLQGANFMRAELQGASFANAEIQRAEFEEADLRLVTFSGANIAIPDEEEREGFWSHILDDLRAVPLGELRNNALQRIERVRNRPSIPNFGPPESFRERTAGSLPGTGPTFANWLAVDRANYQDELHSFLGKLACEEGRMVRNGIARHRTNYLLSEGTMLARALIAHKCADGKSLKETLSTEAINHLNKIVARDDERREAEAKRKAE